MRNRAKKNTGPRPVNGTGTVLSPTFNQTRYTFRYGYPEGVNLRREGTQLLSASSHWGHEGHQHHTRFRRRPVSSTPRPARSIGSNALNLS